MATMSLAHLRKGFRSASAARSPSPTRSTTQDSVSLLSYQTDGSRQRSGSVGSKVWEEEDEQEEAPAARPRGWRGKNAKMPLRWTEQAKKEATVVLDEDFIPNPEDAYSLRHSEYGFDENPAHRSESTWGLKKRYLGDDIEEPSTYIFVFTYISYALLQLFGHAREFFGKLLFPGDYVNLRAQDGYAPLFSDFDSFYTRRLKLRIDDCFARPVSSYNYLGFAQSRGPCADQAESVVQQLGVTTGSSRGAAGTSALHIQCERLMAAFLGVEDCLVVGMGFATNSTTLPALVSKGCLVISDELNHASIRFGARLSGAMIRQFKHNDMDDLESILREAISQGMPRTHRPWKKILVVIEGLYSMEGDLANLPRIIELKARYKFFLFMDEAHSIGALGKNGRGVCDYFGVNPRFGASGGYIAGSHDLIASLRLKSHSHLYAEAMAPPVVSQIITSTASIMGPAAISFAPALASLPSHLMTGEPGLDRIRRLAFNCKYVHGALRKLGFIVYGSHDSPIVPLLVYGPGKLATFSRLMLTRHNIIVVLAAFPATPLATPRIRLCLSSAHTKDDLDRLLRALDDVGSTLGLKLSPSGQRMDVEDVIRGGVEMVRQYERDA
ncbi:hypothetical protein RQP46_001069 [Phenoliferia psychrophenolica]